MQYNEVVATSHDVGAVVRHELINDEQENTQLIEQDGYLYVVDQQIFNDDIKIRASYVMDAVLNYSNTMYYIDSFSAD